MLGLYSMFTGGALEHCAVGALGIMPYISATIIVQLLTAVYPPWSKLAREEGGRTKIDSIRPLSDRGALPGAGLFHGDGLGKSGTNLWPGNRPARSLFAVVHLVVSDSDVLVLTTGTMLLMWLGEQITDRGIGNGVSLIITIGILARLPQRRFRACMTCFLPSREPRPGATSATASRCSCCWQV